MSRPSPPLCVDCRHHDYLAGRDTCKRKSPMTNTVTGEPFWPTCKSERSPGIWGRVRFSGSCGEAGRYFEERPVDATFTRNAATGEMSVQFRWETPSEGEP